MAASSRAAGPPRRPASRSAAVEEFLRDLKPGDYVVHIEHGIARYGGLVRRTVGGGPPPERRGRSPLPHTEEETTEREYMLLYAEGDRLYVPADQTDRVAPYIGTGRAATLHRLGTAEWARTKRRVKEATDELAKELLALYASRETAPGHAYPPDTPWQHELEAAFPYIETPDQMRAIEEVKADMEQPRPMDRLICGDVGYGKTEVASARGLQGGHGRAAGGGAGADDRAGPAALHHLFGERWRAFPVKVVDALALPHQARAGGRSSSSWGAANVDIIIGTHMLLSKNVQFKDLGLVVIDEEQRFGVRHKERLKQLRAEVDVLTLRPRPSRARCTWPMQVCAI